MGGGVESIHPSKAAGLGLLFSAVNPKSLLFLFAGGVTIAQGATGVGPTAASIVIFTVIASSTVALPVVLAAALGDRARGKLDSMRDWLELNNHTVTAVLLLVIGVALIGKGIGGF
jgi:threonine/homoserine/homoserine lactone efflux protein